MYLGINVEYNPELALRNFETHSKGEREIEECIPIIIKKGYIYSFLKRGMRNYYLLGEIPLVETKGNGNTSRPIASVIMKEVTHFVENGEIYTKGKYNVIDLFDKNDDRIHFEGLKRIHYDDNEKL